MYSSLHVLYFDGSKGDEDGLSFGELEYSIELQYWGV